jgi:hypothetical protein
MSDETENKQPEAAPAKKKRGRPRKTAVTAPSENLVSEVKTPGLAVVQAKLEVVKGLKELEADVERTKAEFYNKGWEFAKAVTVLHDSGLYPYADETDGFYRYMDERFGIRRAQAANYVAWTRNEVKMLVDAVPQDEIPTEVLKPNSKEVDPKKVEPPKTPKDDSVTKSRTSRTEKKQKQEQESTDPLVLKKRAMAKITAAVKRVNGSKNGAEAFKNELKDNVGTVLERSEAQLDSYIKGDLDKDDYLAGKVYYSDPYIGTCAPYRVQKHGGGVWFVMDADDNAVKPYESEAEANAACNDHNETAAQAAAQEQGNGIGYTWTRTWNQDKNDKKMVFYVTRPDGTYVTLKEYETQEEVEAAVEVYNRNHHPIDDRPTGEVIQQDVALKAGDKVLTFPSEESIRISFLDWIDPNNSGWGGKRLPTDLLRVVITWAREQDPLGTTDVLTSSLDNTVQQSLETAAELQT